MNWTNPLYSIWLEWIDARNSGQVKFYQNGRIDRLMSDPKAMRLLDLLK